MSETTNYGLYITDSDTERFLDWRNKMNGSEDSNMVKIDTALGEKANNSVLVTTTLLASAWSGVDSPYTQELQVDGIYADTNGTIGVTHDSTIEQREMAREAKLAVVGQSDGVLTIAADGEMPDIDIPVYIILLG